MRKIFFTKLLLLTVPFLAFGQQGVKKTSAVKTDESIKVDGNLNETAWERAPEAGDFIQFAPDWGKPASMRTRVKILYDRNFVYFGFICEDPEPDKIVARVTKRDAEITTDDSVYVLVDTYHDRRNCYFFTTNMIGAQRDGRITENGRTKDENWDGIWKSAGQKTDFGWTVEIAVDLSCLKYKPGRNRNWGLNLGRSIPRLLEQSLWAGPVESTHKVSQYGDLEGLDLEKAEKKAQIIPHLISKAEEEEKSEFEGGLDARYAFSQMVSANLTFNPDFATVEADQEQGLGCAGPNL